MSDIALLLLIFFVVTTQFLIQRSMDVELPSVTPEKEQATKDLLRVYVKKDRVLLDLGQGEEEVRMEQLAPFLAAKLLDRPGEEDRAVILDGDGDVRYERVAWAANEIKRAGGLVTMMQVEE